VALAAASLLFNAGAGVALVRLRRRLEELEYRLGIHD
jgi:hypothetical protein